MATQKLIRMSEKKFENQVRQAMDEFFLSPTAPVWNKIAVEIKRKKDRRRFVLWLLPLALLSGIIWWSLSTNEISSDIVSQKTETNSQNTNKKTTTNPNKLAIPGLENKTAKALLKKQETGVDEENVAKPSLRGRRQKNTHPSYTNTARTKTKDVENRIASNALHTTKKIKEEKLFSAHAPVPAKEKLQEDQTKNESAIIPNLLIQNKDSVPPQKPDTTQELKKPEQKLIDTTTASEQMDLQKQPNKKNTKLQFGAIVQIGFSGIASGLFNGFGQKSLADFVNSNSLQSGSGSAANLPPSNIKRGFSYSLGFSTRKEISSRSAISSGLQYQYYSTRIKVGTKTRDSANSFSRNAISYRNDNQSQHYTNQFHFITLPLYYEYQLFKKLPLHLGGGLHLSQLISSNALHYNSTANIYYRDNSLLNKTQAGLFTRLTYKLWKQKKFSLDLGPQFNYSLTPLQKNSNAKKQHLFFMGLNTQVSF